MGRKAIKLPREKDYPKVIHVRGDTYKITFVKGLKCIGETDAERCTIKIRSGMSENEIFRTFIHEVLHAMEFSWPIKIKHKLVYKLEESIANLILDNFV